MVIDWMQYFVVLRAAWPPTVGHGHTTRDFGIVADANGHHQFQSRSKAQMLCATRRGLAQEIGACWNSCLRPKTGCGGVDASLRVLKSYTTLDCKLRLVPL